jgi:hypothetical protein
MAGDSSAGASASLIGVGFSGAVSSHFTTGSGPPGCLSREARFFPPERSLRFGA